MENRLMILRFEKVFENIFTSKEWESIAYYNDSIDDKHSVRDITIVITDDDVIPEIYSKIIYANENDGRLAGIKMMDKKYCEVVITLSDDKEYKKAQEMYDDLDKPKPIMDDYYLSMF